MTEEMDGGHSPSRRDSKTRDQRSQPVEWVLLEGDRWLIAAGILAGVFVLLTGLLAADLVAVTDGDALTRGFAALIGGNLTLITIVISINQLVLSQEFGTPAELQDRIHEMMEYRKEAEETAEVPVSPVTPNAFLDLLARSIRDEAHSLRDAVNITEEINSELRTEAETFVDILVEEMERTIEQSDEPLTETFTALLTVLDINFTSNLQQARWFRTVHGTEFSANANESLDNLCELFQLVGVLRQYLETLHLQRELALLSRQLFYVGFPAVILSLVTVWVYGHQSGATLDGAMLEVVVAISAVIGFAPLTIFFAYVVRIATVTRRTAGLIPFNVQKQTTASMRDPSQPVEGTSKLAKLLFQPSVIEHLSLGIGRAGNTNT